MSYTETLEERDGYRVRLEVDEYPETPYDDSQSPLLRIEPGRYGDAMSEHIQIGSMRPTDDDAAIENAVSHWHTTPSDSDWHLFERYLRAFFGVTEIETYYSGDYWYVTYNSRAWRKAIGWETDEQDAEALAKGFAKPNMEEYKSWINGDVYFYVVEKDVEWVRADHDDDLGDGTMHTWETVDSCGGYYGDEYAREAALEAFVAEAGERVA